MPDPVAPPPDAELHAHVGRVLADHYELEHELGRGGMGIVYRARDRRLKRLVAVKLLPPELAFRSELRTRFLREAEMAAQLSHPSIVPIYGVDEREGLVYFVMALVDGENLAVRMHDRGPLPPDEVRRVLCEVAEALSYAHARGVVHRDIKPDNILLDKQTGRAVVTDFGIARAAEGDQRLTATGMAIGTPAFMSPEQSAGEREVDGRTDLYALGVVGYQMLAGCLPFQAATGAAMLVKQISERPRDVRDRRPDTPDDLADAVMRCLEKEPNDRYQSADDLAAVLEGKAPALPVRRTPRGAAAPEGASANGALQPQGSGRYEQLAGLSGELSAVTVEDVARWDAAPVIEFRKKVAPYIIVNAVIVLLAVFTGNDFLFITAFWSIFIAFKYAKLWGEGYDWRDVFKQGRDRLLFDVVAETADDAKALFDADKRAQLRERSRRRRHSLARVAGPAGALSAGGPPTTGEAAAMAGPHGDAVRQAAADRDEIARLVASMPRPDQQQVAGVVPSARALYDKVVSLSTALAELERSADRGGAQAVETEITALEAQANPLEREASEGRVRRLAYLKRQRRAMADVDRRAREAAEKLESCRLALSGMRYDVLRLRTGGGATFAGVTMLAERAMSLARDVDGALSAQDAVARQSGPGPRVA